MRWGIARERPTNAYVQPPHGGALIVGHMRLFALITKRPCGANRILERGCIGARKLDWWPSLRRDRAPHPGHTCVVAQLGPLCGTRHSAVVICVQRLLDPTANAYSPRPRHVGCRIRSPANSPATMADTMGVSPRVACRATQKRLR